MNGEEEEKNIEIKPEPLPFVPPVNVKIIPKAIHEYPPYVLGPNDVWPPKYPNSMREFKKEMRYQRKLK